MHIIRMATNSFTILQHVLRSLCWVLPVLPHIRSDHIAERLDTFGLHEIAAPGLVIELAAQQRIANWIEDNGLKMSFGK